MYSVRNCVIIVLKNNKGSNTNVIGIGANNEEDNEEIPSKERLSFLIETLKEDQRCQISELKVTKIF